MKQPVQLRVDDARLARWQTAADREGMRLPDWLKALADVASEGAKPKAKAATRTRAKVGPRGDLDRQDVRTDFKT